MGTERLLVSRHQVQLTSGRRFVAVEAHVAARGSRMSSARETLAFDKTVVAELAGECWETAFWAYRVGEELVGATMVAQRSAFHWTRCGDK